MPFPYTDKYLEYLSAAITDAVSTTGIDGFMIDWLWQPRRSPNAKGSITGGTDKVAAGEAKPKWLEVEKKLYTQLMEKPFPGEEKITDAEYLAYSRKAIDRTWKTIRAAAKKANPKCIVWLTVNKITHPHVINSDMYKEVDWLMNEAGSLEAIEQIRPMVGKDTKLITCFASWNGADPTVLAPLAIELGIGLYGFGQPRPNGTVELDPLFTRQITESSGNGANIATLARAYHGVSLDSVWKDGKFVEPAETAPFRLSIRGGRQVGGATGKVEKVEENYVTEVKSLPGFGIVTLNKKEGEQWPEVLKLKLVQTPGRE